MITKSVDELIAEVKQDVIKWRRYFHQHPELSFEEKKTSQIVYDTLQSFGNLEVSRPTKTSVLAKLKGDQPGDVLGIRADMDALPIQEETDLAFASQNPGVMHACGHDGHTAMLLGAAKILTQLKSQVKGEIRFIFQHAEEKHPGGAIEMVEAGVMDGVDKIIGLHLFSPIPLGKIGIVSGALTSNSDTFDLKIIGKGGHSSQPDTAVDPIAIGAQVITNLQHVVSRNTDPLEKIVISVTEFHAGTAKNIIPDSVALGGSVRTFSKDVRAEAVKLIERIAQGVTAAHGASYQLNYNYGYGSVINDPVLTQKVEETVRDVLGEDYVYHAPPTMGGEDFSAFLQKAPGCFIPVGAGNVEKGIIHPHHHPKFTVDEEALEDGVKIIVNASFKLLD